jgi:hypothetical protein
MPLEELVVTLGDKPKDWPPFEVHAKGVPLWAVLDELALKSGGYFWSLVRLSNKPCKVYAQFR